MFVLISDYSAIAESSASKKRKAVTQVHRPEPNPLPSYTTPGTSAGITSADGK